MPKCKVSVTVDTRIMERVDKAADQSTRSQIIEEALALWIHTRRHKQLESDIEKYYAAISAAEHAEDSAWAAQSLGLLPATWG